MNRRKVQKEAEKHGATLSPVVYRDNRTREILCDAPEGYWFCEGYTTQFVAPYYPFEGQSVRDAYADIYQRLKFGVEPIPEDQKYLYE
jgi:hypothetical protein